MAPTLILFDLDETLFDHQHASRSALSSLRERHSALSSVSLDELAQLAWDILERTHLRVLSGELTVEAARLERVRLLFEQFEVSLDETARREAAGVYLASYRNARRPVDGARRLLDSLRQNHAIGIVTNNFRNEQESKLADCRLDDVIDFMITSEETGTAKPDAAIFAAALDEAQVAPENAVMVGDNWHVDVLGALNAGLRPVWFNRYGRPLPGPEPIDEIGSFEPLDSALQIILGDS